MAITRDRDELVKAPTGLSFLLRDEASRSILFQALTLGAVVLFFWWIVDNTLTNLSNRSMSAGFDFLPVTAGFGIGFTLIPFTETDSYWRVFQVGVLNTLLVSGVSIFFATILGLLIGLARLSSNWIVATAARGYVELLRNTPLLLQIIAWFLVVFGQLPRPRDSVVFLEVFALNNRGFYMPRPVPEDGFLAVQIAIIVALAGAIGLQVWAKRRREATGKLFPAIRVGLAAVLVLPTLAYFAAGQPLGWDHPQLQGFNFGGGMSVPPSFCALVVALSVYTSCFIAELVRGGIQSVSKGQREAAGALNLPADWTMRLIILPQALRVIVPPLISQYLNVTKNSSLAIAIGFPDLVSVWMNTSLNQSGRAIPIVAMTMAFYCCASLFVSLLMNVYNRSIQIRER
jgi:general L-amino acid transport system permease protein